MASTGGVTGALTEGTGVSAITSSKVFKDIVLDFLLTAAAALGTDAAFEAFNLGQVIEAPQAAALALGGALIRTLYRAAIRWAQSDSVA